MARIMRSVCDLARQIEIGMDGGHDDIELGQACIRQVKAAVLEDVDLNPFENGKTVQLRVHAIDLAALPAEPRRVKAMRHGNATAVIGQRNVFIAARLRRLGHRFDGGRAVSPIGMDMEIAANVRAGHETRQLVRPGQRDLAAILAQLREE